MDIARCVNDPPDVYLADVMDRLVCINCYAWMALRRRDIGAMFASVALPVVQCCHAID